MFLSLSCLYLHLSFSFFENSFLSKLYYCDCSFGTVHQTQVPLNYILVPLNCARSTVLNDSYVETEIIPTLELFSQIFIFSVLLVTGALNANEKPLVIQR